MQGRIGVTHDFFAKSLRDYSDWRWAWGRELVQNGIDAGAKTIHFTVDINEAGDTEAVCWNDGPPMTKEVLLDKFLCLGGTTKETAETVGGFGVAKLVIAIAHKHYKIETGPYVVEGSGGDYEFTERGYFSGVRTTVVFEGNVSSELRRQLRTLFSVCQWPGTFYLDDNEYKENLRKGKFRRSLEFGNIYTNRQRSNCLVVRIGGIPMFVSYAKFDGCVVLELAGHSSEVLTSNRDGLRYPYRSQLSDFVTELATNRRSALGTQSLRYRHYDGTRLCHRSVETKGTAQIADTINAAAATALVSAVRERRSGSSVTEITQAPKTRVGQEFVLKNETDLVVPKCYCPDELEFSKFSLKLSSIWGRLMLQLYRTFDVAGEFAIGFLFPEDGTLAQYEEGQFGQVYYIAPVKLVSQNYSRSKSWRKQWKLTDRNQLLATAAHEFVHGAYRLGRHDEDYAGKYTETIAVVMDRRSDFNWCFGK